MKKVLLLLILTMTVLVSAQMGTIYGLDPNGDGFLSLRKKPKSTEIGRLYNGDSVQILAKRGKWYKVKDLKSNRVGWSHSNWIRINSNSNSQRQKDYRSSTNRVKATPSQNKIISSNNYDSETKKPLDGTYTFTQKKAPPIIEAPKEKPLSNTFTFTKSKPAGNNTTQKQIPSSKTIVAIGYGVNKEKALKSAFKSAVQQYVGVLIDADTVVKNDQIIKDEILTASNGYIQSYDEISTEESDGLVEVKIKAVVKSQKVFDKVKSLNIATATINDSKNIYARVVSKKDAKEDAAKILRKTVGNFLSKESIKELLVLGITDVQVKEDNIKDNKVPVIITYVMEINKNLYAQKVRKLEQTFENLGAKLRRRVDFPYFSERGNGYLMVKNRNKVGNLLNTDFGFIKHYGKGYKLDIWTFPASWSDIYPFKMNRVYGKPNELSLEYYYNIVLEIKKSNDEVLLAKNISINKSDLHRKGLSILVAWYRGLYYYSGYQYRGNYAKIISPSLWFGNQGNSSIQVSRSVKVLVDLEDIKNLGSVSIELDEI